MKIALSPMVNPMVLSGLERTFERAQGVSWTTSTFPVDEDVFVQLVEASTEFGDSYDKLAKDHRKTDVAWEVASSRERAEDKWFCVRRPARPSRLS